MKSEGTHFCIAGRSYWIDNYQHVGLIRKRKVFDPIRLILIFLRSLLTRRFEPSEQKRESNVTIIEG